jgi:hypothetical protein
VTFRSSGEFADVSKTDVSCLHNTVRQVDLYALYQKYTEFLCQQTRTAGEFFWTNGSILKNTKILMVVLALLAMM